MRFRISEIIAELGELDTVLHLVGRTAEKPHTHYYRHRTEHGIWTPWERIDVDIETEHLHIVRHQGSLYLFWPVFKEGNRKLGKDNQNDQRNDKNNYLPYYEIKMAWTKYEEGFWAPRKETRESIEFMYDWEFEDLAEDPLSFLKFRVVSENQSLHFYVYAWSKNRKDIIRNDWDDNELKIFFNKLRQKINKIELHSNAINPYPEILKSFKSMHHLFIENAEKIVFLKLFKESGLEDAVDIIKNQIPSFPNFSYSHYYNDSLLTHDLPTKDLDIVGRAVEDLDYDPRTESGFVSAFDFKQKNYIYALAPDSELIAGNIQYHKLLEIGRFDFSGCNFTCRTERYLGDEKYYINEGNSYRVALLYGIKPSYEKYSEELNQLKITTETGNYNTKILLSDISESYELLKSNWTLNSNKKIWIAGKWRYVLLYPPFLFQTSTRKFLIEYADSGKYLFLGHYHPFVCEFRKTLLFDSGENPMSKFDNLLNLEMQRMEDINGSFSQYGPTNAIANSDIKEIVEFDNTAPFSNYNWEIFFHMPFTIAVRLSQNKKFAEAQKWFHYIFNPFASITTADDGSASAPSKYWNVLPLHKEGLPENYINDWRVLAATGQPLTEELRKKLESNMNELAKDPFQPHLVARLRQGVYQKAAVMKYLDNLIAWGDYLFERDTIESINEATHLYILAAKILGPRPKIMPKKKKHVQQSGGVTGGSLTVQHVQKYSSKMEFAESQMMVSADHNLAHSSSFALEQLFAAHQWFYAPLEETEEEPGSLVAGDPVFCVPHNDKLLGYWDTVADRLFKIRNCRNIEGIVRELPIFEPPIDPALLVRGQALGIDINDLLSDLYAPLPPYRFRVLLQKAYEFCGDVRSLGGSLLSALEKKDAEELSLIRAGHEKTMLEMTKAIKKQQIKELAENLKSQRVSLEMSGARYEYYNSRPFANPNEKAQVSKLNTANDYQIAGQILQIAAAIGFVFPNAIISTTGPPSFDFGGIHIGNALQAASQILNLISSIYSQEANMHSIQASRELRMDDWKFQAAQAQKEMKQLEKQILASEIRLDIADKELENHEKQQEHAEEAETFMRSKFTNKQLYHWMASQTSTIYFQTYKMAVEIAKTAQKCYRLEKGDDSATFIGAAHWDNLKKGLLAGEKLQLDLRRMENDYLLSNKRELELTKHISLKALDPIQLDMLRYTGACKFKLPEVLFDLDFPGHYYRRIKSVGISAPAIVGPYSGVNCTLTLTSSKTRVEAQTGENDEILITDSSSQTIALSTGQNDSGLFEPNLNDERYLPFELKGAVESVWELAFPAKHRQFDYSTISDVILHVRYTARMADNGSFKTNVMNQLETTYNALLSGDIAGIAQRFDIRREFPDLWHKFITGPDANGRHNLRLELKKELFPYLLRPLDITVNRISLFCKFDEAPQDVIFQIGEEPALTQLEVEVDDGGPQGRYFYGRGTADREILVPNNLDISATSGTISGALNVAALKELSVVVHFSIPEGP